MIWLCARWKGPGLACGEVNVWFSRHPACSVQKSSENKNMPKLTTWLFRIKYNKITISQLDDGARTFFVFPVAFIRGILEAGRWFILYVTEVLMEAVFVFGARGKFLNYTAPWHLLELQLNPSMWARGIPLCHHQVPGDQQEERRKGRKKHRL